MRLTQKQETFCLKYFELGNAGEAARLARYSPKTAYTIGAENLLKPQIQTRLHELRQRAEDASVASVLERKQVLTEIVRGRFVDFMTKLTPEKLKSAALQEIRITEDAEGKRTTTIKLHSPIQAADLLNKMDKIYSDGYNINMPIKVEALIVNIDAREVARTVLEAIRLGLSPAMVEGNGHSEDAALLSSPADIQATSVPQSKN